MKLDFLCSAFSDYEIERFEENDREYIFIRNSGFSEPIEVCYENDTQEYTVAFATQHVHIYDEDDLIDTVSQFANADMAAIEFYYNGRNSFGGQIETKNLENLTFNSLREHFGYSSIDISHMTFRVYAWNKAYCFEGAFIKTAQNTIEIIKKDYSC